MLILNDKNRSNFKEFNLPKMDSRNILFLSIAILVALALIIFLVRKNRQDGKNIQPDADDLIEEIEADKERRREKL